MAGRGEIRMKKKAPKSAARGAVSTVSRELPPTYDEALMLPERAETELPPPASPHRSDPAPVDQHHPPAAQIHAGDATPVDNDNDNDDDDDDDAEEPAEAAPAKRLSVSTRLLLSTTGVSRRNNSIKEEVESDGDDRDDRQAGDAEGDEDQAYSDDDLVFETYDDAPQDSSSISGRLSTSPELIDIGHVRDASPSESSEEEQGSDSRGAAPSTRRCLAAPESSDWVYDDHTYTIVSRLRAANKRLSAQLEKQTRLVRHLQEEKKQHLQLIHTLRADLQMHRQALKSFQPLSRRPHASDDALSGSAGGLSSPRLPQVAPSVKDSSGASGDTATRCSSSLDRAPASPRLPSHPPSSTTMFKRPRGVSPRSPVAPSPSSRGGAPAKYTGNNASAQQHQLALERYEAKLEKAEQEKKEALSRHGHQLANYSHELSRLERQLEHAHRQSHERENELRLLKTRQLYAHGSTDHHGATHPRSLLADDFWTSLAPPDASGASLSTHIGLAFEQLLTHHAVSLHDHMLDASTREWLRELRLCGAQMLQLHRSFQSMSGTFRRLAESTHLYQLAETLARETRELLRAEQALVFVVDTAEQEFWCRVPRTADATDMVTVRSKLMPFATSGPAPSAHQQLSAARLPCGLASMVFHTKKPLLLPAGGAVKHPCLSTASDNTDRLLSRPGASTLLLPLVHHGQPLGVVQLCGKMTVVTALGLSVSLEKSDAFTAEDQALLQLLTHFASGLFPKVAYFTEVESNKVNEETLIQLAPEIFTCLRFEELGKVVIENAKEILDADRCSLFVADNAERTLHNWQSDISGGGAVQVYDNATKSGMTIPFGHGVVGLVAETGQAINIPDAYADPRFNATWDKKTNYRTKSMLAVPILSNGATTKQPRQPIRHASPFSAPSPQQQEQQPQPPQQQQGGATTDAVLLGVVQVINKSGGAPFRAKDEFLLQTISKLIALAIENSQLFQKTQELCADVGRLIASADLVDAVVSLGAAAEAIIGVESAAVYVYDHTAQEMVTFHRKRRHKIALKEHVYRHALFGDAVRAKQVLIVNDVSAVASFNAYVDSIGGVAARNVLFAPLVVEDPDALGLGLGATKLVGLVHLVNTKGRKARFEPHDLFLSIVSSLCCSVVSSILEKQLVLKQKEQTSSLLDTSMSFFKEMSPIGVINAVYNACTSIFAVEKAHLFLWEPNRRHMWTSKLLPHAETSGALSSTSESGGHAPTPSLGSQHRRISVLTDQKLRVPTTEGLLEQVLVKGAVVLVKHWEDGAEAAEDSQPAPTGLTRKHTLRASASDDKIGFVKHAVVACPVWDNLGLEIAGVLVLLFPRGRAPQLAELTNLPILCRQISGALNVCSDLSAVMTRSRKLQGMMEMSMKPPPHAVSLTLSARGQLVAFSQPVNLLTPGFSAGALAASVHASTALNLSVRSLPLDDHGHRWGFQLSAATAHEMSAEHYVKWIGRDLLVPQVFDRLRTDLQSVYVRKETMAGEIDRTKSGGGAAPSEAADAKLSALPKPALVELRQLLWDFVDGSWRVDARKACEMFDGVDPARQRRVSRRHLEHVLSTGGRGVRLDRLDWDLLHSLFADPDSDLVHVERMFEALAPRVNVVTRFAYEIVPVLDAVTQTVVSVHLLLTAL